MFTEEQYEALSRPIDPGAVMQRRQGGQVLHYVPGHYVIARMNELFRPGNWSRRTLSMAQVVAGEVQAKRGTAYLAAYVAEVEITITGHAGEVLWRSTGHGYGEGQVYADNARGQAHESAVKEAETDAMKRALVLLGNQFGLSLYEGDGPPKPQPPDPKPAGPEPQWTEEGAPLNYVAARSVMDGCGIPRSDHASLVKRAAGDLFEGRAPASADEWSQLLDAVRAAWKNDPFNPEEDAHNE